MYEQIAANKRKTAILFVLAIVLLGGVGYAIGVLTNSGPAGLVIALVVAIAMSVGSYLYGDRIVLASTRAKEVSKEEQPRLHNIVEGLAIAAGVPKPRIWIVPDTDPNAFATGRDAATASIAVTEGLLGKLSRDELQAVVAHEVAHIRNLDVRLMTLLAGMVGAIALMSDGLGRMMGRGGRAGARWSGGRGGGSGKGNPLGILILVLWLLTLLVAPVVSRLLAMAVSRKREYLADATGAQLTRNPMALASALEKLESATDPTQSITRGAAHLCIVDPAPGVLASKEGFVADFLGSHPPIRQRIIRLHGMAYQQAKRETTAAGSPP